MCRPSGSEPPFAASHWAASVRAAGAAAVDLALPAKFHKARRPVHLWAAIPSSLSRPPLLTGAAAPCLLQLRLLSRSASADVWLARDSATGAQVVCTLIPRCKVGGTCRLPLIPCLTAGWGPAAASGPCAPCRACSDIHAYCCAILGAYAQQQSRLCGLVGPQKQCARRQLADRSARAGDVHSVATSCVALCCGCDTSAAPPRRAGHLLLPPCCPSRGYTQPCCTQHEHQLPNSTPTSMRRWRPTGAVRKVVSHSCGWPTPPGGLPGGVVPTQRCTR